ncbi:uncharacterized protein LOC125520798 isoform X1 [Triticum urartu]|uniref:uncharacterized protein LOC125520798 isoform X1 n=1 Tax=Triticum urartu TaxID=4572 RepID=UPI00204387FA|nr:uncharacterized protein LOC125520798 isoform X1 [Triticum urartu]XP_048541778.1 uncharacterized protein LOC125520798 isoform X1 [Triticum urartu]
MEEAVVVRHGGGAAGKLVEHRGMRNGYMRHGVSVGVSQGTTQESAHLLSNTKGTNASRKPSAQRTNPSLPRAPFESAPFSISSLLCSSTLRPHGLSRRRLLPWTSSPTLVVQQRPLQ